MGSRPPAEKGHRPATSGRWLFPFRNDLRLITGFRPAGKDASDIFTEHCIRPLRAEAGRFEHPGQAAPSGIRPRFERHSEVRNDHARRPSTSAHHLHPFRTTAGLTGSNRRGDPLGHIAIGKLPPSGFEAGIVRQRTAQPAIRPRTCTGLHAADSGTTPVDRT